jgi:predicted amidohydrolase
MEALTSVMENLAIYAEQTKDAKKLGADIIVFPEVIFA